METCAIHLKVFEEEVYRLPIRDGNRFNTLTVFLIRYVYRLPIRDGNSFGYPRHTWLSNRVYRLPIRDGNTLSLFLLSRGFVLFIDYL